MVLFLLYGPKQFASWTTDERRNEKMDHHDANTKPMKRLRLEAVLYRLKASL